MSTTSPSSKVDQVAEYLRDEAARADGALYVKSKFIADDLDLSAKEIGWSIRRLSEVDTHLTIEKWSYTGGTTWRISR